MMNSTERIMKKIHDLSWRKKKTSLSKSSTSPHPAVSPKSTSSKRKKNSKTMREKDKKESVDGKGKQAVEEGLGSEMANKDAKSKKKKKENSKKSLKKAKKHDDCKEKEVEEKEAEETPGGQRDHLQPSFTKFEMISQARPALFVEKETKLKWKEGCDVANTSKVEVVGTAPESAVSDIKVNSPKDKAEHPAADQNCGSPNPIIAPSTVHKKNKEGSPNVGIMVPAHTEKEKKKSG